MSRYQARHAGDPASPSNPGRGRSRVRDSDRLGSWFGALLWVGLVACVVGAGAAATALIRAGPEKAMEDTVIAGVTPDPDVAVVERPQRPANAPAPQLLAPSAPAYVEIPAIGVQSGLEALDLGPDGILIAPTDFAVAGWFAAGTQPGQPGPAVIAGHVDSDAGPAVFFRLEDLVAGDEVLVGREDGAVIRFVVTDVQRHPKETFPADAVYGPVPGAELRLVTCDGIFDRSDNSYEDNLIVFAVAADRPDLG